MPQVKFTSHLRRFYPGLHQTEVTGKTVAEIICALDRNYPGLAGYLIDDQGALRQHVNIFVGDSLVRDRQRLQDSVAPEDQLFVFQAPAVG